MKFNPVAVLLVPSFNWPQFGCIQEYWEHFHPSEEQPVLNNRRVSGCSRDWVLEHFQLVAICMLGCWSSCLILSITIFSVVLEVWAVIDCCGGWYGVLFFLLLVLLYYHLPMKHLSSLTQHVEIQLGKHYDKKNEWINIRIKKMTVCVNIS